MCILFLSFYLNLARVSQNKRDGQGTAYLLGGAPIGGSHNVIPRPGQNFTQATQFLGIVVYDENMLFHEVPVLSLRKGKWHASRI